VRCAAGSNESGTISTKNVSIPIDFVPQAIMFALLSISDALNLIVFVALKIGFVAKKVASVAETVV